MAAPFSHLEVPLWVVIAAVVLWASSGTAAELGAGTRFDALHAGKVTYHRVEVKNVGARYLTILHEGGLSSVALRDLSPELQSRFGYDRTTEAVTSAVTPAPSLRRASDAKASGQPQAAKRGRSRVEIAFEAFGRAPALSAVDLRPAFFELGLEVKDQGRRPSCAVFAVVSALEFQTATFLGRPEKLSEEYLVWATRRSVQRVTNRAPAEGPAEGETTRDVGFTLSEVVTALRTFGIPSHDRMPNRLIGGRGEQPDPSTQLIEEARHRRQVSIYTIPGRDHGTLVANIVHALNAGVPVAVGMGWPPSRTVRSGYLSLQQPVPHYSHAVTLVGYRSPTGRLEDSVFLFKNSWGANWGMGGYGQVTHEYLQANIHDAVLLDVGEAGKS